MIVQTFDRTVHTFQSRLGHDLNHCQNWCSISLSYLSYPLSIENKYIENRERKRFGSSKLDFGSDRTDLTYTLNTEKTRPDPRSDVLGQTGQSLSQQPHLTPSPLVAR